ncbi:MAG: hypothetical protein IJT72_07295 [Lachnospiraceae bacterium]|nr:hypothetical protein [Lachnospiraceae bacterium]
MFDDMVSGNDDSDGGILSGGNIKISDGLVRGIVYVLLGIIAGAVAVLLGIRAFAGLILLIKFLKAGLNDKLIIRYSIYCKNKRRFDKEFRTRINYNEQITHIYDKKKEKLMKKNPDKARLLEESFDLERIVDIIDRAGFSNREISREEYDYVCDVLF